MTSPTLPVPANHDKPRDSSPHRDTKEGSVGLAEKKKITDLDIKSWSLPRMNHNDNVSVDDDVSADDTDTDTDDDDGPPKQKGDKVSDYMTNQGADVDSEEAYHAFSARYYHDVRRRISKYTKNKNHVGTLLHTLLHKMSESSWKVWVKFILDVAKSIHVSILKEKATSGNTCLHVAIEARKAGLDYIKFICAIADDQDLEDAIAAENGREQSCIDLAISQLFLDKDKPRSDIRLSSLQILEELTLKTGTATFAKDRKTKIQNSSEGIGNLPLHDLVHIDLCRRSLKKCALPEPDCSKCRAQTRNSEDYHSAYMRVLKTMVIRYPEALRKVNKLSLSPFLFHCYTRNKRPTTKDWGQLEFAAPIVSATLGANDQAEVRLQARTPLKTKDAHRDGQAKDNTETNLVKSSGPKPTSTKHQSAEVEPSKNLATAISQELLELCLSQKSFSDVCDSLFGEKFPSSELIFKASPLTAKTTDLHRNLPLEPMLACVELGLCDTRALALDSFASVRDAKEHLERDRNLRENRVQSLFKWLRDNKGVKRIIRLVVYDHPQAPCRDEVIKLCLQKFDVRYLDWNKEDLSVDMLQNVAPNLQELWLTWSGRKSALFGWCNEKYGLRLLKQLGTLYISIGGEWESSDTNKTNLEQFKTVLKEAGNMPKLEIKDGDEMAPDADERTHRVELQGVKEGNLWIEAINTFRKALVDYFAQSKKLKAAMNGAVKVAIIDDGVDLVDLGTTEYITGGWYPDRRAPDRGHMNAWYISEKKHGTEMARLIQLVWPFLNLYIAKLDTRRRVYKSVAASAAEAINKAVDNGANVISMSWTIYQSKDSNDDGLSKMKDAMEKAEKRNIIMFCASQDSGFSGHRKPYPATNRTSGVKRIGSAGVYGERSEYVNPEEVDYLFPGEVAMSDEQVCSGSSAATALAAGLAGLILWCCALQEKRRITDQKPKAVAKINDANKESETITPLKRANSKLTAVPEIPQSRTEHVDFQNYERMYGLFDVLCSKENPLVNITPLLHAAAKDADPARALVQHCRGYAHKFFE